MMRDRGRHCAARALPPPSPRHSKAKGHRHVRCRIGPVGAGLGPVAGRKGGGTPFSNQSGDAQPDRTIAARGRPDQLCPRRSESPQWREAARAEDPRRQGPLGAKRAEGSPPAALSVRSPISAPGNRSAVAPRLRTPHHRDRPPGTSPPGIPGPLRPHAPAYPDLFARPPRMRGPLLSARRRIPTLTCQGC